MKEYDGREYVNQRLEVLRESAFVESALSADWKETLPKLIEKTAHSKEADFEYQKAKLALEAIASRFIYKEQASKLQVNALRVLAEAAQEVPDLPEMERFYVAHLRLLLHYTRKQR